MTPPGWPIIFPAEGPILKDDPAIDRTGGHPTQPGDLDKSIPRNPTDDTNRGNGRPGKPRYKKLATRHQGMVVGNFAGTPKQPGVEYDSGKTV